MRIGRADILGAYRIRPQTSLLISSFLPRNAVPNVHNAISKFA
jgi:hypothetical protein